MELNEPLIGAQAPLALGMTGLLIGEPDQQMSFPQRNTPNGGVGKKSRGPSAPDRYGEGVGGDGLGPGVR